MVCSGLVAGSYDIVSLSKFFGVDTLQLAEQITIPAIVDSVPIGGYYEAGDGGGAMYARVVAEPSHEGKFQDLTGAWFELRETIITAEMFAAIGDDIADDFDPWNNAIAYAKLKGASILGWGKRTYRVFDALVFDGVEVDFQGCTINSELTGVGGADYGPSAYSNATLKNGAMHTISHGILGTQGIWHSGFCLGNGLGDGSLDPFAPNSRDRIRNVLISNMTFSTNAAGKLAVAVMGDVQAELSDITIPTSATQYGAFSADWSYLGVGIDSNDIPGCRTAFDASDAWTTHPCVTLKRWNVAAQTRNVGGNPEDKAIGIRLSGCYGCLIEGNHIEEVTGSAYTDIAGDLGFEFAPDEIKPLACRDTKFTRNDCLECNGGTFLETDTFSDDIYQGIIDDAYVPRLPVITKSNNVYESMIGVSSAGTSVGCRVWFNDGLEYKGIVCRGFLHAFEIQENAQGSVLENCEAWNCQGAGFLIGQPTRTKPDNITVRNPITVRCGINAGLPDFERAGLLVDRASNILIEDGEIGAPTYEIDGTATIVIVETAVYGMAFKDNGHALKVRNNTVYSVNGGVCYGLGETATSYGIFDEVCGNDCATGLSPINGCDIISHTCYRDPVTGNKIHEYMTDRTVCEALSRPPDGFVSNTGDVIRYRDPNAGSNYGLYCFTGGVSGVDAVWKLWNAIGA